MARRNPWCRNAFCPKERALIAPLFAVREKRGGAVVAGIGNLGRAFRLCRFRLILGEDFLSVCEGYGDCCSKYLVVGSPGLFSDGMCPFKAVEQRGKVRQCQALLPARQADNFRPDDQSIGSRRQPGEGKLAGGERVRPHHQLPHRVISLWRKSERRRGKKVLIQISNGEALRCRPPRTRRTAPTR